VYIIEKVQVLGTTITTVMGEARKERERNVVMENSFIPMECVDILYG
jgi:hypothetical protein